MVRSTSPVVLLLLLPLSVSNAEFIYRTVTEGQDAILSCGDVFPQTHCEPTVWTKGGQRIEGGAGTHLPNCSLLLPRVTKEQNGAYGCKLTEENTVQLFVASLSQRVENGRVTFICSVASTGKCSHDLKWFNNNETVLRGHKDLQISDSGSGCDLSVSFNDPSPPSAFYQTLKCQVRQTHPTQIFTLVPRPPALVTVGVGVPVAVCVVLVLVSVALILWTRRSGGRGTAEDGLHLVLTKDGRPPVGHF